MTMPEERSAASARSERAAFVPFDLRTFAPNRAPMLDLYYRAGNTYVLLCAAQAVMTRAARQRLLDSGVRVVYARIVSGKVSAGGLELPDLLVLPDEQIPVSVKAGLMYFVAVDATRAVVANTESTATDIAAVGEFVGTVALHLSRDPETLQALLALMRHESFVYVHSVNVASLSTILALRMGVGREDAGRLSRAAFLHDVGTTKVPLDVLNKRGVLNKEDWRLIRQHPEWSVGMLGEELRRRPLAKDIIMQHHERLDGTGYPHGLSGGEIHPLARLVTIVDMYDAMTSERPYRQPMAPFDSLDVIRREGVAGHLDRDILVELVRMLAVPNSKELEKKP